MGQPPEIKDFYDEFSNKVLLEDFRRFNLRQRAVRRLCGEYVPAGARVLEIGCGVGINVKHLQKRASRVVGVDLSERNIEIARAYAGSPATEFRALDILDRGEELVSLGPFDAVVLPDVIEHIPKNRYPALFATIERVLTGPGLVLLTYPSPEYQRYLREHEPRTLQIVDEVVNLEEIVSSTSLSLVLFKYVHVWRRNQYVHAVLSADRAYDSRPLRRSLAQRARYALEKRWWRLRHRSFVRNITGAGGR